MELVYKILYIPTGQFLSSASVFQNWKTLKIIPTTSKKGRSWKRWCDILVAWKTLKEHLEFYKSSKLIEDYRIQIFSLQLVDTMNNDDVLPKIEEKAQQWKLKQIKNEIANINWRIEEYSKKKSNDENDLKSMYKELEKLKKLI